MSRDDPTLETVRDQAKPFTSSPEDYSRIIKTIGPARYVLLGEGSHGTHDFYRVRAQITKHLLMERGFHAVAVEADWPDAFRINKYVRAISEDEEVIDALADFERFPIWMWRNADVLDFIGWLRAYNDTLPSGEAKIGFYGLDLYSLHRSITAVIKYLQKVDPAGARRAIERYGCFGTLAVEGADYGQATTRGAIDSCEEEVVRQLAELQRSMIQYRARDGSFHPDDHFFAEQNARLVKNAEEYYRVMYRGRVASWNLRDQHMVETLYALSDHLQKQLGEEPKIVVWAHNSHLGDARATEMSEQGEWNVGQLVREKYGERTSLIGFTTHQGTVTAASDWDEPPRRMKVVPGREDSYEGLFHEVNIPAFWLDLREKHLIKVLDVERLERAIGVIYRPDTERYSHYFGARLARQFDLVLHLDQTRAVEPLDRVSGWSEEAVPETYPSGL